MKKALSIILLIVMGLSAMVTGGFGASAIGVTLKNQPLALTQPPYIKNGSAMVPMRDIFEDFGATVEWDGDTKTVTAEKGDTIIVLTINSIAAKVNGKSVQLPAAAEIQGAKTFVPLRFVGESLGERVEWNSINRTIHIGRTFTSESTAVTLPVNGRNIKANVVRVDLTNPVVKMKVALGQNRVGQVQSLEGMANAYGAKIAINGNYFDAYTAIKEPYGVIVTDGRVVHTGSLRSVFGFKSNNEVDFSVITSSIEGTVNGGSGGNNSWYSYWLNRTPAGGNSVIISTPDRGTIQGHNQGVNVVVENDVVKNIVYGDTAIPSNGYLINFMGIEQNTLLSRFKIGNKVDYTVNLEPKNGHKEFWSSVQGAVSAGPGLLTGGNVTIDMAGEGFTEDKILKNIGARSAVGVTKDKVLILVTTPGATVYELASIMQQLGASEAMNLDGGASSGMYYHGKYITKPGRELSTALLISY